MVIRSLSIWLLLLLCQFLAAQQEIVYPQSFTTNWKSIAMGEEGHGIAVGTCGTMGLTDDGQNWTVAEAPDQISFNLATCLPGTNCQTILLSTGSSNLPTARSFDGGQTWDTVDSDGFYFFSDHPTHLGQSSNDQYRYTTDGISWTTVNLPLRPANAIRFVNADFGYYRDNTGTADLVITNDGGQTWTVHPNPLPAGSSSVYFQDPMNGWITNFGFNFFLYQTTDGGDSWNLLDDTSNYRTSYLTGLGNETLFLWGYDTIAYSIDGGATMDTYAYVDLTAQGSVSSIAAEQLGQEIWLPGNHGQIFYTSDVTEQVTSLFPNVRSNITDIAYADDNTAYAVTEEGQVLKSIDSGVSWTVMSTSPGDELQYIEVLGDDRLIVYSKEFGVLQSSNGGTSWQQFLPTEINERMNLDHRTFTVAPGGRMHVFSDSTSTYSDDNGSTWTTLDHDFNQRATVIKFRTSTEGYVIGNNSQFYLRTLDGGQSWEMQTPSDDLPTNALDLEFFPNDRIIAIGRNNYYSTDDGGLNWNRESNPKAKNFVRGPQNELYLSRISGSHLGGVYQSLDEGMTWQPLGNTYCSQLRSTAISPDGTYMLSAGLGGTIIRSSLPGLLNETATPELSKEPLMLFPNPTDQHQITLTLPTGSSDGYWALSIVDLSGKEVMNTDFTSFTDNHSIRLPQLVAGYYTVRLLGADGLVHIGKLVVL